MKQADLRDGDLIFVAAATEMAAAIQTSTGQYSHVGLYLDGQLCHATTAEGVVVEKLSALFDEPGQICHVYRYPQVDVADLRRRLAPHVGKPYNHGFYPETTAFYCSQLIAAVLPIFETVPMRFGDESQPISPFWQAYYTELGTSVPLGAPGTNPTQLSTHPDLDFLGALDD